jgi:hypothetical protein
MSGGLSRRAFLVGGTALAGTGAVALVAPDAAAALLPASLFRGIEMRRSAFLPLLGETFEIVHAGGMLPVVLRQVSDLAPAVRPGCENQFSLMFTDGGLRPPVEQGIRVISHARQGQIALFVVPVERRKTMQRYQVIVDNRSLTPIS